MVVLLLGAIASAAHFTKQAFKRSINSAIRSFSLGAALGLSFIILWTGMQTSNFINMLFILSVLVTSLVLTATHQSKGQGNSNLITLLFQISLGMILYFWYGQGWIQAIILTIILATLNWGSLRSKDSWQNAYNPGPGKVLITLGPIIGVIIYFILSKSIQSLTSIFIGYGTVHLIFTVFKSTEWSRNQISLLYFIIGMILSSFLLLF